jgi:hypothetical protein
MLGHCVFGEETVEEDFVTGLRAILAVVLALLWAPITSHCLLERTPGLEFLSCCQHEQGEQKAGHEQEDCSDDPCAVIERGFYKIQENQDAVPAPALIAAFLVDVVPEQGQVVRDARGEVLRAALPPLNLQASWQFSCRAAGPVRAPTLLA